MSEVAESSPSKADSASKSVTESDDEMQMGLLNDVDAAVVYQINLYLPDFVHLHGPLICASNFSSYEISARCSQMSYFPVGR